VQGQTNRGTDEAINTDSVCLVGNVFELKQEKVNTNRYRDIG
jgi:hypothetical protein